MSKVIFKRKKTNEIENLEVQDGSLIFNTETGAIFMDYGTKRISIFDNLYPVGSIIIRDNDIDMSNYLGFTWEKVFAGKVLVGVDSTDNDFKTIGKTGGSKDLQEHTHSQLNWYNQSISYDRGTGAHFQGSLEVNNGNANTSINMKTGGVSNITTGNSGNLQPYQVVAYWKRIE